MFIDKVKINIKAGNGGNGAVSFRREKGIPLGGPDGGAGGMGGDIIFSADRNSNNLGEFRYVKHFRAKDGEKGFKKNSSGKSAENLVVKVPRGTIILDADTQKIIADIYEYDKEYTILRGGKGGRGNTCFKTPTRQAPAFSEQGEQTKEHEVILELKTIADVGIIGFPNAGKSTLLSVISNSKPKIGNYYFTTLFPNLGVVNFYDHSFVVADIPGLIEGASGGAGLGHDFLRHIERTRMLVHLIDIAGSDGRDPIEDYKIINKELKAFSKKLAELPQLIVLNKSDIASKQQIRRFVDSVESGPSLVSSGVAEKFPEKCEGCPKIIVISALKHENIEALIKEIYSMLQTLPVPEPAAIEEYDFDKKDKTSVSILKLDSNYFEVSGGFIDELIRGIVISDYVSNAYFQKRLKDDGIIDKLKAAGAKEGDTIKIKDVEFELVD